MLRLFLILLFTGAIAACSDSHEDADLSDVSKQETKDHYASGMTSLKQGDSCMAYWHWSLVKQQLDKTFDDTIRKYKLKTCVYTE